MKGRRVAIGIPIVLACAMGEASPAPLNPLKDIGLEGSDVALLEEAARKLYEATAAELGSIERWANQETGSSGVVRLIETFEYQGMPCRRLRHLIERADRADPLRLTVSRCQIASGEWRLLGD